jgi:hypothetical protein
MCICYQVAQVIHSNWWTLSSIMLLHFGLNYMWDSHIYFDQKYIKAIV